MSAILEQNYIDMIRYLSVVLLFIISNVHAQHVDQIVIHNYELLSINTEQLYRQAILTNKDETIVLELRGEQLYLLREAIIDQAYTCLMDGSISADWSTALPLKGYTSDGRQVVLTLAPTFLLASIVEGQTKRWFEMAAPLLGKDVQERYITYLESDIESDNSHRCAVHQISKFHKHHSNDVKRKSIQSTGDCYQLQYAICHDYSMTQLLGSAANVASFGIGITNELNTLYDDEFADELKFVITGQYISTSTAADPWTNSTEVDDLLTDFTTWAGSGLNANHDLATLWTDRDLTAQGQNGVIGYAWLGVVCEDNRYNICEHISSAGVRRVLLAHEIGHNFSLDHVSGPYVMNAISSPGNTSWESNNVALMESYYTGLPSTCLESPCPSCTPSVQWASSTSSVVESDIQEGVGGFCDEGYIDHYIALELTNEPSNSITINISADLQNSTVEDNDFELLESSITFVPGGPIGHLIPVRLFDDKIEESDETLKLDIAIASGTALLGSVISHTITIVEEGDQVTTECCGGTVIADNGPGSGSFFSYIFAGGNTSSQSRFIITAAQLAAMGLSAGPITKVEILIGQKNSTGPFNNFSIGMANYNGTTLPSTWIATTSVFNDDINTSVGYNAFELDTPFDWDGTSSLYFHTCFDNGASSVGFDFHAVVSSPVQSEFGVSFSSPCDPNPFGFGTYVNHPVVRLTVTSGAKIETAIVGEVSSSIASGETAHFYSLNDKVIASLTNTGAANLDCVDLSVYSSGLGTNTLPGGNLVSAKSIHASTGSNGTFKVDLYYTDAELAIWGGSSGSLYVLQSLVPFDMAGDDDIRAYPTTVSPFAGDDQGSTYSATVTGLGSYFAIGTKMPKLPVRLMGDLSIQTANRGIVVTSLNGTRYLVYEGLPGDLLTIVNPQLADTEVQIIGADFNLVGMTSIYFKDTVSPDYSVYSMTNNGQLQHTSSVAPIPPYAGPVLGSIEITRPGGQVIMTSPDGNCHGLSVTDDGEISISPMACP